LLSIIDKTIIDNDHFLNLDENNLRELYFLEVQQLLKIQSKLKNERGSISYFDYETIIGIILNDLGIGYDFFDFYVYMHIFLDNLEDVYKAYTQEEISFIINEDNIEVVLTKFMDNFNNLEEEIKNFK
tara:strand:- start:198 stop:581 length:384 start_codon:yes stop_codon:yes gene_type:complete